MLIVFNVKINRKVWMTYWFLLKYYGLQTVGEYSSEIK